MWPPHLTASSKALGALEAVLKTEVGQFLGNYFTPSLAALGLVRDSLPYRIAGQIKSKSHNMQPAPVPLAGEFNTGNQY